LIFLNSTDVNSLTRWRRQTIRNLLFFNPTARRLILRKRWRERTASIRTGESGAISVLQTGGRERMRAPTEESRVLLSMQNIVNSLQARTGVPFAIGLPDGSRYRAGLGEPAFTVLFRSDAALLSAFTRGHMGLLESYFDQSVDVESDLAAALAAGLLSGLDMHAKALNSVEYGIHGFAIQTTALHRPRLMPVRTMDWGRSSTACGWTIR
jgi:hypothetical protein